MVAKVGVPAPKAQGTVEDTSKRAEILGVVNELEDNYAEFATFFAQQVEALGNTTNVLYQEVIAEHVKQGEEDYDTALRQAIDLLREFAESL